MGRGVVERLVPVLFCAGTVSCAFFDKPNYRTPLASRITAGGARPPRAARPPRTNSPELTERQQAAKGEGPAYDEPSSKRFEPKNIPAPAPPVTAARLDELLSAAERLNPKLLARRERIERRDAERFERFSAFLPRLNVTYRYLAGTSKFVLPTYPTAIGNASYGGVSDRFSDAEFDVQLLVWDFGVALGRYGRADKALEIARLEYERAAQTIAFDVTVGYFEVLRAIALRDVAREGVQLAETVLRDTHNFERQGTAIVEDVERARTQLAQMRLLEVRSDTRLGVARAALNRSVGYHVTSPVELVPNAAEPPVDRSLPYYLEVASEQRFEFHAALVAIDSARLGLGVTEAKFFPRVFVGGTGVHVDYPGDVINQNFFYGGVTIELNIFDGGKMWADAQAATAEMRESIARAESLADAIAYEVVTAYLEVSEWRQSIRLGEAAVTHAQANLVVQNDLYDHGDATSTDIVDAELLLIQTQADLVDATYGYQIALARIQYATGALTLRNAPP
jgi:outer membrane protein